MLKTIKHNKIRNTGLIYQVLIRQLTAQICNETISQNAIKIFKKNFKPNTQLAKEHKLYQLFQNTTFDKQQKANQFIDKILQYRKKLNQKQLKQQKYNIIKQMKKHYDLQKLFSTSVLNYKLNASIYKLFQSVLLSENYNPTNIIQSKYFLIKHLTNPKMKEPKQFINKSSIMQFKKQDKQIKQLAYKLLLQKFNKKYDILDVKQKKLIKKYIDSLTNTGTIKQYIEKQLPIISNNITSLKQSSKNADQKKILTQVQNQLPSITKKNVQKQVYTLLNIYQMLRKTK